MAAIPHGATKTSEVTRPMRTALRSAIAAKACPMPLGRAYGKCATARSMAMRPMMGMMKMPMSKTGAGRSSSSDQLSSSNPANAATPNEPVRLSFMISSMRSRLRPEKRPSTVSMKPSACRPPVKRSGSKTRMALPV